MAQASACDADGVSRMRSTPTGADCWSLAGGSGMWACPKVLTVYWLGRRGLAATTQVQRRAGTCGHASHTHTITQLPFTSQKRDSTRPDKHSGVRMLGSTFPFVPSNHHHIYTDFVGRGLITGHESCAFEQHPAQFVQ